MFSFHHVALSVRQLDVAVAWYAKLGFAEVYRWQAEDASLRIVQLKLGAVMLELFCFADNADASAETSALFPHLRQLGPRHFGLQVGSVEAAREAMIRADMTTESVVITEGKTGVRYFFLRDPDGNFVEILEDRRIFSAQP